jgi:hypothetical protein
VIVSTVDGPFELDLESGEAEPSIVDPEPQEELVLNLPRLIAAAAAGSTVVAVVDAKPPLLVSHDAGATWRDAGRGLPAGRAVAIAPDDPDTIVYATSARLYVSRDGGVFWSALEVELPEIVGVAF